jgi:hypothetical protein
MPEDFQQFDRDSINPSDLFDMSISLFERLETLELVMCQVCSVLLEHLEMIEGPSAETYERTIDDLRRFRADVVQVQRETHAARLRLNFLNAPE